MHFFIRESLLPLLLKRLPVSGSVPLAGSFSTSQNPFFCAGYVYFLDAEGTTLAAIFDDAMEWRQ
jgi:hypothetical protein